MFHCQRASLAANNSINRKDAPSRDLMAATSTLVSMTIWKGIAALLGFASSVFDSLARDGFVQVQQHA
jgi:hypothetical protein